MQVKYIGTCDKQDSIRGIGLHWTPGQMRHVTAGVAERLLFYPDTWIKEASEVEGDDLIDLNADEKPTEEPLPVVDFHSMTKQQMADYAQTRYGEKLDMRQTSDNMRHRLVAIFGQRELDKDGEK